MPKTPVLEQVFEAPIKYSGSGQETTIRSHWRDEGDTSRIVAGRPL